MQVREVRLSYRGRGRPAEVLREPEGVARLVRELVRDDPREHFVAVFLNGRHRPIGFQVTSIGTATASLVHPREVYQPALVVGAVGLVVAHNHPSGDPLPSAEDRGVTRRLHAAGKLVGVELIDSVVVVAGGFYSMRAHEPSLFEGAA